MYWTNRAAATEAEAEYPSAVWHSLMKQGWAAHCNVLRDIFGNPFHPISLDPGWTVWNNGLIRKMAGDIYNERRFGDLPILADALEDAGCTEPNILSHCRGPGPHVRGCWVVDLLLGKQ
jgi:hypothetical protein